MNVPSSMILEIVAVILAMLIIGTGVMLMMDGRMMAGDADRELTAQSEQMEDAVIRKHLGTYVSGSQVLSVLEDIGDRQIVVAVQMPDIATAHKFRDEGYELLLPEGATDSDTVLLNSPGTTNIVMTEGLFKQETDLSVMYHCESLEYGNLNGIFFAIRR